MKSCVDVPEVVTYGHQADRVRTNEKRSKSDTNNGAAFLN
jgi:hypothetical protein